MTDADVRALRAIAHPVRNRVLGELGAVGPLRAADVAQRIGIPANQASFHLRQLAKYGLVEEAPELARDGRDRVWRLTHEEGNDVQLSALERDPHSKAAVTVFRRQMADRAKSLIDLAFRAGDEQEKGGRVTIIDDAIALTKDEAGEYVDELAALNARWRTRARETEDAASDRRTYALLHVVQPYPATPAEKDPQ